MIEIIYRYYWVVIIGFFVGAIIGHALAQAALGWWLG